MNCKPGTKLTIEDHTEEVLARATVLSNGRVMIFGGKGLGKVMKLQEWYDLHQAKEADPTPIIIEVEPDPEPVPEPPLTPKKKTCLSELLKHIRHALGRH